MPRRASLGTWLYFSRTALVLVFMSLRASTGRRARPSRPPRSAPAPHPGDAVLTTVPSHARLADSLTPLSPPASHLRPPPPPLPRSPPAPRGKRHATPAHSSMVARLVASSKPIAAGGAGAGAAAAAVGAATGKPTASSPPPAPAPRPINPSTTPRTYPSVRSPPPTTYRAVSCATSRTASSATATPPAPSHRPHARRRPLPVTGPRTAPRGQLRHATRDCPLQSLRATVTPQDRKLYAVQSNHRFLAQLCRETGQKHFVARSGPSRLLHNAGQTQLGQVNDVFQANAVVAKPLGMRTISLNLCCLLHEHATFILGRGYINGFQI